MHGGEEGLRVPERYLRIGGGFWFIGREGIATRSSPRTVAGLPVNIALGARDRLHNDVGDASDRGAVVRGRGAKPLLISVQLG